MAAGFRSPLLFWLGGINASSGVIPPILCPCPEYGIDATLQNVFTNESTLNNVFQNESTIGNLFSNEMTLGQVFTGEQTLISAWKRGQCN